MADKTKKDTTHNPDSVKNTYNPDSASATMEDWFLIHDFYKRGNQENIRRLATTAAELAKVAVDAENSKLESDASLFSHRAKFIAQVAVEGMDANPAAAKQALQTIQNPETFEQDLRAAAKGGTAEIAKLSQHSNQLSPEDRSRMTLDLEGWAQTFDPNGNQATNAAIHADRRYERDHPVKAYLYPPLSGETPYGKAVTAEYNKVHDFYAAEARNLVSGKDAKYAIETLKAAGVPSAHDTDNTLKTPSPSHNASDKSMAQSKKNP